MGDASTKSGRSIELTLPDGGYTYDGTAKQPAVDKVMYAGSEVAAANYDVTYTHNVDAGSATVTVTGKREYTNTFSTTFNIAQRNISSVTIDDIASQVFTGYEIKPVVTVKDMSGDVNLIKDTDYDLVYTDNIHVGTAEKKAKVTLKAKNLNYKGTKDVTFAITAKPLDNEKVTIADIPEQKVDGTNPITPALEIKDKDGDVVIAASNYSVSYSNNTAVGTATATITFTGDYSGTATKTFEIKSEVGPRTLNVAFEGSNQWATFYWYENLEKPTDLEVYAVTGHEDGAATLKLAELNIIPAGWPVLLKRTNTSQTTFTANITETAVTSGITRDANLFKGTYNGTELSADAGVKFVLLNDQFVQSTSGVLPANRCYLNFGENATLEGINTITIKSGVGPDDIIYKVDDADSNVGGSAVKSGISGDKITLTVTPNTEYFVEAGDIKVTRSVSAVNGRAQAVAPEAESGDVAVTAVDASADPNGVTKYTFPADANSKYQVTINFHKRYGFDKTEYKPSITLKSGNFEYNGQEQKPEIDYVTVKGQRLDSEDYEFVRYEDNIYPGGSRMYIRGKRKYTGENNTSFSISQRDIKEVTVDAIPDQFYTGEPIVPEITVTDIVNSVDILNRKEGYPDYKVTIGNNTNVGTATVSIDANNINYKSSKTGITFKILPKNLSLEENKPTIAAIADQPYDGTAKTPELVIKDGTRELVLGTDYEVTYANNIDAGIATVSINFIGNYTGSAEKAFGIVDPGYPRNVTVNFDSNNAWTTYYPAENLTLTEDLKAYVVTGMQGKQVNVQEVTFMPRNVPILLHRVSGDKTSFDVKTCSGERLANEIESKIDNELFKGTDEAIDITTVRGAKFVLINEEFKQVVDGTLPKQRCYLVMAEVPEGITSLAINKIGSAITYQEEGSETTANIGTATASNPADGKVTLTVRPKVGYYINGAEDITVIRNANAGKARAQQIDDGSVTVTAGKITDNNADYSTTYLFTYPSETDCQYQVTVNFHKSIKLQTEKPTISVKAGTYVYDGKEKQPELTSVTLPDGTQLTKGTDFLVIGYEGNVNAGTGKVKINGIRKYTDEYTGGEFSISQRDINNVKVNAISDQTYTGAALKPSVVVTDIVKINDVDEDILNKVPGQPDYEVEYLENVNAGVAQVNIKAKSINYTGIKTGATFKILPKDLSAEGNEPTIGAIADQYYTGSPIEPKLVIKDGALTISEDNYDVEYENNILETEVSGKSAVAKVTFKGNYKGTAQTTFKILFKSETKALNINFEENDEWTTYYSPIDIQNVEGVNIFVVTGLNKGQGVDLNTQKVTFIPKNIGVLLQRTDKTQTTFNGTTMPSNTKLEGVTPDAELFRGTSTGIEDMSTIDGVKYILVDDRFIQVVDGSLAANRCYVFISNEDASGISHVDGNNVDGTIVQEEGQESKTAGTVVVETRADGYRHITISPASVTYATINEIKVVRSIKNDGQAASRRAPGVETTPVEVLPETTGVDEDPSGPSHYKFKYDSNYNYQVTVNFKKRIALNTAQTVITLKAADIQNLVYDGKAKTPAVEKVTVNGKTLNANEYEVAYENNTNAGKGKRVVITGKRIYKDSKFTEFEIKKRDFSHVTVKEPIPDQEYNNGAPIVFRNLVLEDIVDGVNIVQEGDYTIHCTYTEIGAAKVSFTPANNYEGQGTKEYSFNIIPATGIEQIPVDELEGQWYDLNGQRLQGKPTQKGVYVLRTKSKKVVKVRMK